MKILITTDVRQDEEILFIKSTWFDEDCVWKMIRDVFESHKTHRLTIVDEKLEKQ